MGEHLDTADLEEIAICYDKIRELRKRIPQNDDFEMGKQFDKQLRKMLEKLAKDLKASNCAEEQGGAVVNAKSALLELLIEKFQGY